MAAGKETDTKLKYSKVTDLSNTLFIFTSNVGEHKIASSKRSEIGFGAGGGRDTTRDSDKGIFIQELKREFAPEFIGRMDSVVRCHPLSLEAIRKIFELHVSRINKILEAKKYGTSLRIRATEEYVDNVINQS